MGARAKIIRKPKRRFRYEAFALLFCVISAAFYLWAMIGQKNLNYNLALQAQELQQKVTEKKEAVASLQSEVNALANRDRIVSMAAEDGIKTNQDQVVILTDTE